MSAHLHRLALTERLVLVTHARWMSWNLLLAVVPLVLALVLFRPGRSRTKLWWAGAAMFIGFLPNAPYVLTDAIHLVGDARWVPSPSTLFVAVLATYAFFFAAGFGCYVGSLNVLRRYLRTEWRASAVGPCELALHGVVAVGVFLGRFDRLNSWDFVGRPSAVLSALVRLAHGGPMLVVVAIVAVIGTATWGTRVVQRAGKAVTSRFWTLPLATAPSS